MPIILHQKHNGGEYMSVIDIKTGNGLFTKNQKIIVDVDPTNENISVSDKGLYVHATATLDGKQYVDEWTVVSNRNNATDETAGKIIRGNARVITKCYNLCFLQVERLSQKINGVDTYLLRTKDPNHTATTANDLKTVDDVIREINFCRFYAAKDSNGRMSSPWMVPRPGSLFGFSDVAYGTKQSTSVICENGSRFSRLTSYTGSESTEKISVPQKLYAMFIATHVSYSNYPASQQGIKGTTPSGYLLVKNMTLQCIWSDTTAFNGLLDTDGWRKGDSMSGKLNLNNVYGTYKVN